MELPIRASDRGLVFARSWTMRRDSLEGKERADRAEGALRNERPARTSTCRKDDLSC